MLPVYDRATRQGPGQGGMGKAGGISIHGVDIARGVAATGLAVEVYRLDGERRLVASGRLGADGTLADPIARGEGVVAGTYEVLFHLGDWYAASGGDAARFLDVVPFRFELRQVEQHYHLPFKFTPWGIQLFRGV
jgi:5-hydroxyisourate hydrolase